MRVGVAEARERFKEILDRVEAGEEVEITRRGEVVAVLTLPSPRRSEPDSFGSFLDSWRSKWDVDQMPDDDPFANLRDQVPVRPPPW
jgi:prevent-host-death family protein